MTSSLLLDTCALLWLGNSPECLTTQTIDAVETAPILYASPISLWEVAMKCRIGKLELSVSPEEWFETLKTEYGISMLPLDEAVLSKSASLPFIHRDPADRFIIATALLYNLVVVTKDRRYSEYGVRTIS